MIVSNSGRNPVPIEMAMEARGKGLKVIAVASIGFSKGVPSRHFSGLRLADVADVVIDNGVPPGDASVEIGGLAQKMGPVSASSTPSCSTW